jgi:hypothetical protein
VSCPCPVSWTWTHGEHSTEHRGHGCYCTQGLRSEDIDLQLPAPSSHFSLTRTPCYRDTVQPRACPASCNSHVATSKGNPCAQHTPAACRLCKGNQVRRIANVEMRCSFRCSEGETYFPGFGGVIRTTFGTEHRRESLPCPVQASRNVGCKTALCRYRNDY